MSKLTDLCGGASLTAYRFGLLRLLFYLVQLLVHVRHGMGGHSAAQSRRMGCLGQGGLLIVAYLAQLRLRVGFVDLVRTALEEHVRAID